MKTKFLNCQNLLLVWMCLNEFVSWSSIKNMCNYLNQQFKLGIEEHPAWHLFLPLFAAGNVEYYGEHKFRITSPIAIHGKGRWVFSNVFNQPVEVETPLPWIYSSCVGYPSEIKKCYEFNALSILRHIPKCKDIISQFDDVNVFDNDNLVFYNHKKLKVGVAWKNYNEHKYYFVGPDGAIKEIPHWSLDPEATNIAFSYTRVIDEFGNGSYDSKNETLKIRKYRFPIILYRILIIECLLSGENPQNNQREIIFNGISPSIVKELNRILEKSILYE